MIMSTLSPPIPNTADLRLLYCVRSNTTHSLSSQSTLIYDICQRVAITQLQFFYKMGIIEFQSHPLISVVSVYRFLLNSISEFTYLGTTVVVFFFFFLVSIKNNKWELSC